MPTLKNNSLSLSLKLSLNLMHFVLIVLCCSCSNYNSEQTIGFDKLNDSIQAATSKAEAWAQSPASISKHLFPAELHLEGNKNYSIRVDCSSEASCDVTVIDEGRIDDKVYGKRWNAYFEKTQQCWQLTKLTKSLR
ncbi:MAG: hypothetical protein KIT62_01800 [Cyclobacteriaceae bacterium]|nr:hypothetical protein [Cyclobacteriaceae bacterium]